MPTRLGQNFLKDKSIIDKIIQAADLAPADLVIEIGPGQGILTEELEKHAGQVLAIELDDKLIPLLQNKFKKSKNIEIIQGDILKINLTDLILDKKYKVIANIPYYITSPIIRLFLESARPPQEMILMVQKEVAERIASGPGKMSILAVAVQYYAIAEILFPVSKSSFAPMPEVDSAVIKIIPRRKYSASEDKHFFRIVRAGFSAKRKTLVNNLSASLQLDKSAMEEKIKTLGLGPNVRAQELSVSDWKNLAKIIGTEPSP